MGYNVLTSGFFVALAKPKAALMLSLARGIVVILACLLAMSSVFRRWNLAHADGEPGLVSDLEFYFLLIKAKSWAAA